ncbi:MAG: EAL domain-containing protein [Burkholderiaceae bacterium]
MPAVTSPVELNDLSFVFQPIVSLRGGSVLGCEGLLLAGKSSPRHAEEQLYESAPELDSQRELEFASIRTLARAFGGSGGTAGKLFLSIAPGVLRLAENPLQRIEESLLEAGLSASQVVLEVSDHQPMLGDQSIYEVMCRARGMGFEIALNHLGEGAASLRVWSDIQPHYVKIDQHFVRGLHSDPVKHQFVRTVWQLSHALGTKVIGEGVEHAAELYALRDLGVEFAQGHLFSAPDVRPLSELRPDVQKLILNHRAYAQPPASRDLGSFVFAEQLGAPVEPVASDIPLANARHRFEADPKLLAIPVVDKTIAVGILSREAALAASSGAEGVSEMRLVKAVMDRSPLLIDSRMSLEALGLLLAGADPSRFAAPFIINERGVYRGLANAQLVLRELSRSQERAARYADPLTALPGQVQLQKAIEGLIEGKGAFVAALCDIDHLKAYNQVFGYPRGDNLIQYAGILIGAYCDPELDFLGYLGSGKFVALIRESDWRERCENLIAEFDVGRQAFLSRSDVAQSGYYQKDRRGNPVFHALPRLSIGAAAIEPGSYTSYHQVVEAIQAAGAEAKKGLDIAFFVERRRPDDHARISFEPED